MHAELPKNHMSAMFDSEVCQKLHSFSWSESRTVAMKPILDKYAASGIEMNLSAKRLLEYFSDFRCDCKDTDARFLDFSADAVLFWSDRECVDRWSEIVGKPICPVAVTQVEIIMVSDDFMFNIVDIYDNYYYDGMTVNQAFRYLLMDDRSECIKQWLSNDDPNSRAVYRMDGEDKPHRVL